MFTSSKKKRGSWRWECNNANLFLMGGEIRLYVIVPEFYDLSFFVDPDEATHPYPFPTAVKVTVAVLVAPIGSLIV